MRPVEAAVLEQRRPGRIVAWLSLVLSLTGLNYASRFSGAEPPEDIAYRYSAAIAGLVQFAIMLGILLLIARGLPLRDVFALRRPPSWPRALGLALLALITIFVASGVLSLFLDAGEEQGLVPDDWDSSRAGAFVAFFLVVTILGPVVEELMYRGIGFTLLAPFGAGTAILLTGLLFGASHGLLLALPVLAIFGVVLGWLRWKTASLYPPVLLHAVFNGTALVFSVVA
jgi:membrane protease YdiL (CAAX protease family)